MIFSVEIILGVIALILIALGTKEFFQNNRQLTAAVKTKLRVSLIFIAVIIFNLLVSE